MAAKARKSVKSFSLAMFMAFMTSMVYGLDFPHVPSNAILPNIGCLSCHDLHGSAGTLLKPSTPNPDMGDDNTEANNLCWSCHTGPGLAPYRVPHSSEQIGVEDFGTWHVECKDCHNPHNQSQFQTYGTESFLAAGVLEAVTSGGTSTLTDNEATWTVDEHAGRVVFPDINVRDRRGIPVGNLSYRVLSNTATVLTLDGTINTAYIAAGDTYGVVYGKIIRNEIKVPGTSTWKQVKFFGQTGTNSFADSDATLDGVCQVCHTKTAHFKNDGTGIDQLHMNGDRGDPTGTAGENCTELCHQHIGGFGHGTGYTKSDLCIQCHGHEEGTIYDPDGQYPYFPNGSTLTSRGFGSVIPHTTHTESWTTNGATWETTKPASAGEDDLRGPGLYCSSCHDIDNMPTFRKDGAYAADDTDVDGKVSLAETSVCAGCHSPGGDYNGVNSVDGSVGAKDNWHSEGIYDADYNFKPGKEKWCAGCHDNDPSHIILADRGIDITAPEVIGDETEAFTYGTGWGFYKTGHGTPSSTTLPATGGVKAGPDKSCTYCHQSSKLHIDGDHRTFDCSGGCDSDDYGTGYRMRFFAGAAPLAMPRTGAGVETTDFLLCLRSGCHGDVTTAFTDPAATNSNFYDLASGGSLHYLHLNHIPNLIKADWGAAFNSRLTCIGCHNPHGTKNHSMIRTGELVGNSPIRLWFWNTGFGPLPNPVDTPNPDDVTLAASNESILISNSVNDYCAGQCHGAGNWREVVRTPFQVTDQPPMLLWPGITGYEQDGVSPDAAAAGSSFTFRVKYKDYDNDAPDQAAPRSIYVWVDIDDDDVFEIATEKFVLDEAPGQTMPYSNGRDYTISMNLSKAGDGVIKYYFEAADADGAATGQATVVNSLKILNATPQLAWTGEAWYEVDGVNPDTGGDGGSFTFRVTYTDADNEAPTSILMLEDLDLDGTADGSYAMTPVAGGDYVTGKIYTYTKAVNFADTTAGSAKYAFSASDGIDAAIGDATAWQPFTVLSYSNTPAVLEWVSDSADCRIDSAKPNTTIQTGSTELKLKYTDTDDWGAGPASVTLLVDLNGNGTYDGGGESIAMAWVAAGSDNDWTNGEYYEATGVTPTANGSLKYTFEAVDVGPVGGRTDPAVGDPTTTDKLLTIYDSSGTTKGVRTAPASSGPTWYNTIQAAIDAVSGAHVVLVDQGTYVENLSIQSYSGNDNDTTLKSICGADITVIQATSSASNVIATGGLSGTTTIDGFQVTGGANGFYNNSGANVDIRNSKIHNNATGGVNLSSGGALLISDSELYSNTAGRGGAVSFNGGSGHTFTNTTFSNNVATDAGGAVFVQNISGALTLTNVTFSNNTATNAGGAISTNGRAINATQCTFSGNQAGGGGGAVSVTSASTFDNCVFADNSGSQGGVFYMNGGTVAVKNSTLANNSSTTHGGAIYSANIGGSISNSIIWGNSSGSAQGHATYFNGGTLTLTDVVIQNDGDADLGDEPVTAPTSNLPTMSGFLSDLDPNFVNAAGGDYHIQYPSDAIDNAGAGALSDDRDGNTRSDPDIGAYEYLGAAVGGTAPTLAWTGEANFVSDGVTPDSAIGGSSFEFRVDYTDAEDVGPAIIELWIDENGDDAFGPTEKYAMAAVGGGGQYGDGDYSNGERYTKSIVLTNPGGGHLKYRFVASDGVYTASGDPELVNTVQVDNRVPTVAWPGDTNYESDGVHPDLDDSGASFTYRIMYTDPDNSAPVISQVWIDENDSMFYDSGEYNDMAAETPDASQYRDGVYSNGEYFTFTKPIYKAGDGRLYYRLAFSDGVDDATGDPASQQLAKERYSRYFMVMEYKTVAGATSIAAASDTAIDVSMAYTGDGDEDNTLTVEYGVKPGDTNGWTTWSSETHPASPYETTIAGLISGETYDVKMSFIDPDGVLNTAVATEFLTLPVYATAPGTATAVAGSYPSIEIAMPYTHDGNENNTYSIRYRVNTPQGAWIDWGTNPKAHVSSPYADTITGLASAETYDVELTYTDADGINGVNGVQTITGILMPTIHTVCPSGCDFTSIQAAIDAAASGDLVEVKASGSPYSENIVFDALDEGVYVMSDGGFGSVTIRGASSSTNLPVVKFTAALTPAPTLDGFTIDNWKYRGTLSNGIYIENGASPIIKNSKITDNQTDQYNANIGGGIHIAQGGATIEDTLIGSTTASGGNFAEYGAGIYAKTAAGGPYNLTITNSTISYNTISNGNAGGGINITNFNGTVDITDSSISNNSTSNQGGGIYLTGTTATVTVSNSTIADNSATNADGGGVYTTGPISFNDTTISGNSTPSHKSGTGIYLSGATAAVEMDGSTVSGHSGSSGAGIYVNSSTAATPLTISNSTISANTAASNGGAIYMVLTTNPAILDNSSISGNSAQYGGGIYTNNTPMTIVDSTIDGNSASQNAGGIFFNQAASIATITGSTISNNTARGGAGFFSGNGASVTVSKSTFISNLGSDSSGGAINNQSSTLVMDKSYIKGNKANGIGGGLYNNGTASATLTNTIIHGNVGGDANHESGGGIYNTSTATLNLYSCTISGNYAQNNGGGLQTDVVATVAVENTIIFGNTSRNSGPDLSGALTSAQVTYSDIGGWTGGGATNPTPVDPIFVSVDPASIGTPTTGGDYRLQGTSTLIDIGGGANLPADDIEDQYRPVDGDGDTTVVDDIGADEYVDANDSTTAGLASALMNTKTSIDVAMPYTNDSNLNNTYTVDYKLSSELTVWTNWVTDAARVPSIYTTTIIGLTSGETYDVRMTYNDINGVTGENPQTVSGVVLPGVGKAVLHPSGEYQSDGISYVGGSAAAVMDTNDGSVSYGRSDSYYEDYYLEIDDVGTVGTVNSVQAFVVARRSGSSGTINFDIDIVSGSTRDSDNAYHTTSSSDYQTFAGEVHNVDPNTGLAWTLDAVNDLRVIVDHRDRTDMNVTEVYVVVNDTPVAAVNTNIHPSAAGAGDAITYTGGTAVDAMDSNDGSTSYGYYNGTANDSYSEMDDPTPASDINSVTVKAVGMKTGNNANFRLGLKVNGTIYYSASDSFTSTSYVTKTGTTYTINPDTGLEWTWADTNDLIAVVDHTDADDIRITELYIQVNHQPEAVKPDAVVDLATGALTDTTVALSWTAPGDDGSTGTASSYDIRYNTVPIISANWGSSTLATGEPVPSAAGTPESFTVTGLSASTLYYFAIKTSDEVPNISGASNVPSVTTTAVPLTMTVHPSGANASDNVSSYTGGTADIVYDSDDGLTSYGRSNDTFNDYYLEMDNPAVSGAIQSVQVKALVRSVSGTINFDIDLKSGATTDSDNANHTTSSTSFSTYSGTLYTTDPNTSSAWTWAAIDALVAIIDHTDVTDMVITEIYLEVKYFP